jgi:hypothetical protein
MNQGDTLSSQGTALLQRLGVWDIVQHTIQADVAIGKGHQLLGQVEKARVLGFNTGTVDQTNAELEFALARRHAAESRQSLQALISGPQWATLVQSADQVRGTPQMNTSLQEAHQRWSTALLYSKLSAPDVQEVMQAWDDISANFQAGGYASLFKYIDDRLAEFDTVLQPGQNWGRNPHSPLEWWQWLIIGVVVGVVVAAIAACLFWSGCSWILAIFEAICAVSVGSGAWYVAFCFSF